MLGLRLPVRDVGLAKRMSVIESSPENRRRLWLAADVAAHAAVLAWLVFSGATPVPPQQLAESALTVFDVAATSTPPASAGRRAPSHVPRPPDVLRAPLSPKATLPPPPSLEEQVAAIIGDRATVALAVPVEQAFSGLTSSGCDLTGAVQGALQVDPAAMASVARLPPATLSIANAFMLWDGGWVAPRVVSDRADLEVVHSAIAARVLAASPECRMQEQVGPRLIVFGAGANTVTLVVGSGVWKWGDLANSATQSDADRKSFSAAMG